MGKSILNVVGGVEVECYDQAVGQFARVVIRNSKGQKVAVLFATVKDSYVTFTQQSSESFSEKHSFIVLSDQQFC